jgi:hypothetical protein
MDPRRRVIQPQHHSHKILITVIVILLIVFVIALVLAGVYFFVWRRRGGGNGGDVTPVTPGDKTGSFGAKGTQNIGHEFTTLKLTGTGGPWTNPGVYNTSGDGVYKCPVDGTYYFSMTGWLSAPVRGSSSSVFRIRENKSKTVLATNLSSSPSTIPIGSSCTASYVKLKSGDEVEFQISQSTASDHLVFTGNVFGMLLTKD